MLLNTEFKVSELQPFYDYVLFAVYSASGIFDNKIYQHELCEKPLVRLPVKYKNTSYIIMDGPFMCFDPLVGTNFHLLGNVQHAIHTSTTSKNLSIPSLLKSKINKGVLAPDIGSKFDLFKTTYDEFFDHGEDIEHVGSMYTIRTVIPNRDHDDARPTIVECLGEKSAKIFSGKIVTCITAGIQGTDIAWKAILNR